MGPTCLSALFQRALSALSILALSLTTMGLPVHAVTYAVGSCIDIPLDERAQRAAGI
jgi:hypothetical protein